MFESLLFERIVAPTTLTLRGSWATRFSQAADHPWLDVFEELARFAKLVSRDSNIERLDHRGHGTLVTPPLWTNVLIHRLLCLPQQLLIWAKPLDSVRNTTEHWTEAAALDEA